MSDIKSKLKTYLTTIADAIREKKGTTEPINASNFASEILSIQSGGSLNVAYSLTPPTDTSKIWLQCEEPTSVEVQNYLGECAVSNVANWGVISNPIDYFTRVYARACYIGNNQIAIVGYNKIAIYNISTKSYIKTYTISVGTSGYTYTNILIKDNVLYFGYDKYLYSYDLETKVLAKLISLGSDYTIKYIFFSSENEIQCLCSYYYSSSTRYNYVYLYNLETNSYSQIVEPSNSYGNFGWDGFVHTSNNVYYFYYSSKTCYKYDYINKSMIEFTSYKNFLTDLGLTSFEFSSAVYDGERYIYIIGGGPINSTYNNIIKYDTLNDTFELLEQKLLSGKKYALSVLVDNRVYIFGGETSGTNYGRTNQIDYFDLQYPLTQNNAIITINNKIDKYLPLINTEKLKINSNIASAYKGNVENLAEKVNAYYWDGSKWVGINRKDYFEWFTIPNQATQVHNNITIDLTKYYITDKEPTLSVSVAGGGISANISDDKVLSITINEVISTTTIVVTATVNGSTYNTQFSVEAIASA